ncbi:MAG TPA: hypothetical protein VJK26_02640 [Patescibacteria group bacterium]|nr:hypothetical protein [Patescibacteria group bacterium]
MKNYHSIILDTEFKDPEFVKKWKILGKKKSRLNPWWQLKVEVPEDKFDDFIKEGQKLLLNDKFYFHIYCEGELYFVWPKRIFKVDSDKSDWQEMLDYAKQRHIPDDQMDIPVVSFDTEAY